MSYPTPDQWRHYKSQAMHLANEYRTERRFDRAYNKLDDARFYENAAKREEWRLSQKEMKYGMAAD